MINLLFTIIDANSSHIFIHQTATHHALSKADQSCQGCKKKCTNLSLFNLLGSKSDFSNQYTIPKNKLVITNYANQTLLSLNLSIQQLFYLLVYSLFIPLLCFVGTIISINFLVPNKLFKNEIIVLIFALIISFLGWLFVKKTIQKKLYQAIKEVE